MGELLIGTSGFSYRDWRGVFYPEAIKPGMMLEYYAAHFPVLELDFSYYRMPDYKTIAGMERRTPDRFLFAVKAHQSMTHSFSGNPELDREAFRMFRTAMDPLRDQGKLGCILVQFPWGFQYTPDNLSYLEFVREELRDDPVVVEFRNIQWVRREVTHFLLDHQLGFCCVDEPRLKGLFPPVVGATSDLGYIRFHGRNAAKWWKHDQPWERYDYLYSRKELEEWQPKVLKLMSQTRRTMVLFNNCHAGQAVINARMLRELMAL